MTKPLRGHDPSPPGIMSVDTPMSVDSEVAPTHPALATESAIPFPIVALGASAGGLDALRQLFADLPPDAGLAYVVVQHLDPDRPSMLAHVLEGAVEAPVVEITDGMRLEANRVHVIPSGADLDIHNGTLALIPWHRTGNLHLPIDSFFSALARDQGRQAIGVVLSGSGADGTLGLRAIKDAGGIALVQSPDSAQFRSMPESAVAAGVADVCASPRDLAREIVRLSRHPYVTETPAPEAGAAGDEQSIVLILTAVRHETGIEFDTYKRNHGAAAHRTAHGRAARGDAEGVRRRDPGRRRRGPGARA